MNATTKESPFAKLKRVEAENEVLRRTLKAVCDARPMILSEDGIATGWLSYNSVILNLRILDAHKLLRRLS